MCKRGLWSEREICASGIRKSHSLRASELQCSPPPLLPQRATYRIEEVLRWRRAGLLRTEKYCCRFGDLHCPSLTGRSREEGRVSVQVVRREGDPNCPRRNQSFVGQLPGKTKLHCHWRMRREGLGTRPPVTHLLGSMNLSEGPGPSRNSAETTWRSE